MIFAPPQILRITHEFVVREGPQQVLRESRWYVFLPWETGVPGNPFRHNRLPPGDDIFGKFALQETDFLGISPSIRILPSPLLQVIAWDPYE